MSRLSLTSDGTANGTRVTDTRGRLMVVESVALSIQGDKPTARLQVDLCQWSAKAEAEGEFYVNHPLTGKRSRVARIEFADGTDWSA